MRFREAFPNKKINNRSLTIGFVGHSVAISGYEIIMGLGKYITEFHPRMYAMRVFDTNNGKSTKESFRNNGIELITTEKQIYKGLT